jgi:hypothetical protein
MVEIKKAPVKTNHSSFLILSVLLLGLVGCTFNQAHGPQFTPAAVSSPERALIYIYRPADNQGGYNKSYQATANGVPLPNIQFNGYYSHEINPGHVLLTARPRIDGWMIFDNALDMATAKPAQLDLDVKSGQVYYVKFHREMSMWGPHNPELLLISNEEGQREILTCKLSK